MLSKISVKKPYTVVVGVILVIIMGIMAFSKLSTDLLPSMNLPYAIVITTYPGASPEQVESVVTKPIESAMATVGNINHISSTSSENVSTVILEFTDSANMDSVTVEMRETLDTITGYWPDMVSNPIIMKLNPDMMPVMMLSVDSDGMDADALTKLVNETIMADMESIDGVASVTATGLVEKSIEVRVSPEKIEALNKDLMAKLDEQFDEAQAELDSGRNELTSGKDTLNQQSIAFTQQMLDATSALTDGKIAMMKTEVELKNALTEVNDNEAKLLEQETQLITMEPFMLQLESMLSSLYTERDSLNQRIEALENQPETSAPETETQESSENPEPLETTENTETTEVPETIQNEEPQAQALTAKEDETTGAGGIVITEAAEVSNNAADTVSDSVNSAVQAATRAVNISTSTDATIIDTMINNINQLLEAMGSDVRIPEVPDTSQLMDVDALRTMRDAVNRAIALLEENNISVGGTQAMKEAIAQGKVQLEAARAQINAGLEQIGAGQGQLSSQESVLNSTNASVSSQMGDAKVQLAMGESQLTMAQSQLEASIESAKAGANLENILTVEMVQGILTAQNFSMPAGYVTEDDTDYLVRVGDKITDVDTLENLVLFDLSDYDLGTVTLKDVAVVENLSNAGEMYSKVNGNDGILLSVEKQTNYSTADVAERVRTYMENIGTKYEGVHMMALMDQGVYIDMVVDSVLNNLMVGAVLAIFILFIFLKDIRPTLVVGLSIPVSVIFAIALMYFSGVTMNIISLSGLALGVGMLVDNSIVVIENIYRLRNLGIPVKKAAIEGAQQVAGAILASTLTTVCIWTPIVFVEGITKQLFMDLVLTIAYSLLASLIVALTVVPMASAGVLRKTKNIKHPWFDKIVNGYEKVLRVSLKHRIVVLVLALVVFLGSMAGLLSRGMEFMGEMDSTQISVNVTMPEDSELEATAQMADTIIERILTIEDVDAIGAMTGSSLSVMSSSSGSTDTEHVTMYVILKEDKKHTSQEVARMIQDVTSDLECEVSASGSTMDMSALGGSGINAMIKGSDIDTLKSLATEAAGILKTVEGTLEVSDGQEDPVPELRISVNKEKAMVEGLTVAQIYQELAGLLQTPSAATTITVNNEDLAIVVVNGEAQTMTRQDIRDMVLTVTGQDGEEREVKLRNIAEITEAEGLSSIQRDAQQRYITVSAMVDEEHNATLVGNDFKDKMRQMEVPDGYSIEFSGEDESTTEAITELVKLLALGIIIMYLIMVAQFQSLLSPFIVLFTIPLAFTGGFLGLLFTGNILSVIGMVGFVMLTGIIVNNGIVFIDYTNQLRQEGKSKTEALVETGRTRLRPILMTAMTTILAMTTMALGIGSGTDMVQPMAIVTIGGLIYGTLLTLLVVPVIYSIFNRKEVTGVVNEKW